MCRTSREPAQDPSRTCVSKARATASGPGLWGSSPQWGVGWGAPGWSPTLIPCPPGTDDLLLHLQELQRALGLHQACGTKAGLLLAKRGGGHVLPLRPPALLQKLPRLRQGLAGPAQQCPLPLHRGAHPGDPARDGTGGLEEQAPGGHHVGWGRGGLPDHGGCRAGQRVGTGAEPGQGFWYSSGRADPRSPLLLPKKSSQQDFGVVTAQALT